MTSTLRWIIPALVVLVWLGIAGAGGPFFGRLAEVQSQSAEDFLPTTAESTIVRGIQQANAGEAGLPAILVFSAEGGLDEAAQGAIASLIDPIRAVDDVSDVSPPIPSGERTADGLPAAMVVFATVDSGAGPEIVVDELREILAGAPAGIETYVTGPAGFAGDLSTAFGGIDGILLLVAVGAVLVILILVYRSPILPLIVLFSAISALGASVVLVYFMADAGWIVLNGQAQGILFILVVGAATDYALLLVARYRDALRSETNHLKALRSAWRGVLEPIAASAGTVIAGLLILLLSDLNSNQALGPVATVGIICAFVAALTLLPALLALIGRPAFFPAIPRASAESPNPLSGGLWAWVAGLVERRPRALWIVSSVVLLLLAAAAPRIDATGVAQSEIFIGEAESVTGQEVLATYFPAGSGTPVVLIAPEGTADQVVRTVLEDESVTDAAVAGSPFNYEGQTLVEIDATLIHPSDSDEALDTVERLRIAVADIEGEVLVGGSSATNLDTLETATRDLWTIVPIVLVVITLILILLLRSVLAPVLLIITTAISYLAALGISALVFEFAFGFPGADPAVPLFAFVFLVALGIDYNIFLTTRVREEALQHGTRPGILRGLQATGGVITSAGIVLAATFAALAVIPILFLVQIAFIVALGVLVDAIVVRSILVPGLFYDIGPRVWWPSRRAQETSRAQ